MDIIYKDVWDDKTQSWINAIEYVDMSDHDGFGYGLGAGDGSSKGCGKSCGAGYNDGTGTECAYGTGYEYNACMDYENGDGL